MLLAVLSLAAAVAFPAPFDQPAPPKRDYTKFNVCQAVPGDEIARAFGGTLVEARPYFDKAWSRCGYIVAFPQSDKRGLHVVWIQPAEDFEELKKYIDAKRTEIAGLGDGAYMFQDSDGRFKINVLKKGDLMFQATGESAAAARKVADVVLATLSKKTP